MQQDDSVCGRLGDKRRQVTEERTLPTATLCRLSPTTSGLEGEQSGGLTNQNTVSMANLGSKIVAIGRAILSLEDAKRGSVLNQHMFHIYKGLIDMQADLLCHSLQQMIEGCYARCVEESAASAAIKSANRGPQAATTTLGEDQ